MTDSGEVSYNDGAVIIYSHVKKQNFHIEGNNVDMHVN